MESETPPSRYYGLMWILIALFGFGIAAIIIGNEGRPNTAITFGLAMFALGAFWAFQGKIGETKWLLGGLLVLQSISLVLRFFISDNTLQLAAPGISRQAGILSSAASTVVLLLLFIYARSLEKLASTDPSSANRISDEKGEQLSPHENSAWSTAIKYFPELDSLHSQLKCIDAVSAEKFKSDRLALKDFSNAQTDYWRLLNEIAVKTCGSHNSEARAFLLNAINNGDYETARHFIALGRTLGAENMNIGVLEKFKSSRLKKKSGNSAPINRPKRSMKLDSEFDDG